VVTCVACGREIGEAFSFCPHCGAAQVGPASESRKTVTVVFCDLVASTALAEKLDPESLSRLLSRYFERMREVIELHGGTVAKFIGDAIVAGFGIPAVHEDDALRALRAAVEMRSALAELDEEVRGSWGLSLSARTGVNTGEVLISGRGPGEALAVGDAMNVAARLEQEARPGDIVLSATTRRLVSDVVAVEPLGPLDLKGRAQPVEAFRLVELLADRTGRRLDSPMIGRGDDLARLLEAFGRVVDHRSPELLTVVGEAGMGKSRLLGEFTARVAPDAAVFLGRCLPYGEGITYWPLLEVVRQAAGIAETDEREESAAKVERLLRGSAQGGMIARRVSQAVGFAEGSAAAEEIAWAVRNLLEHVAASGPAVVVFDDIHWAEPTFLDLIEDLVASPAPTCSNAINPGRRGDPSFDWSPSVMQTPGGSWRTSWGEGPVPAEASRMVLRASQGNPLFLEQMVSMLVEEGTLAEDDTGWAVVGDLSRTAAPPSIQALLAARLDALPADERAVIEAASVVGMVFYAQALEATAEPAGRVEPLLEALRQKNLVSPAASDLEGLHAFGFRHILVRDSAYGSIPKARRADLHLRFAGWMETIGATASLEFDEILGYHLEQAHWLRADLGPVDEATAAAGARATELLHAAGRRAALRGDTPAATNLLTRVDRLLPEIDERRVEVMIELANADQSPGLVNSPAYLERAIERARELGLDRLELRASIRLDYQRAWNTGSSEAIVEAMEPYVEPFERLGDLSGLSYAWRQMARGWHQTGQSRRSAEGWTRALGFARQAGDSWEELETLRMLFPVVLGSSPAAESLRRAEEVLAFAVANDDPRLELSARFGVGYLAAITGDLDAAWAHMDRGWGIATDFGMEYVGSVWRIAEGLARMMSGDLAGAETVLRQGVETLHRVGAVLNAKSAAAELARVLCHRGSYDEASELATFADIKADDGSTYITALAVKGRVAAARGHQERAEALAAEAVGVAGSIDDLEGLGLALVDQAEVLRAGGKLEQAADALRAAIAAFEERGNEVAVAWLKDQLASVT
jgi:class 3 adenylate cyclase/tetratricopeptide (TPR) repeat protein